MRRAIIVCLLFALTLAACTLGGDRYRIAVHAGSIALNMRNQNTSDSDPVLVPSTPDTPQPFDGFLAEFAAQSNRKSYKLMKKAKDEIAAGEKWGVVRQTMKDAERAADGGD